MRTVLSARIAALDSALAGISEQVRQIVATATRAALTADLQGAETVISEVVDVAALCRQVAEDAVGLMAGQHPMARDLRLLLTAGRIADSLRRTAALAGRMAKTVRSAYPGTAVPPEAAGVVADMGTVADTMLARVGVALAGGDPVTAEEVQVLQARMDRLHGEMLTIVRSGAWPHAVGSAVDLTLLSRDFERIGAHAVDVATAATYVASGLPPARLQ